MEDSQHNSIPNMFSVRIVSIDYYMAPPIPSLDISYSTFQGGKVNEVPVIRIFGSTPAGQKTCLHIHRALPYFYFPCGDLYPELDGQGDAHAHALSQSLEKGLKLKGSAGSKRQHIHSCSVVRAKKFYGYHSSEEPFMKIYLYHPQDVSRAANLLREGTALGKVLQPHESHIPFILQFMVDYNLYGMGHIHVSKLKFRNPVPHSVSEKMTCGKGDKGEQKDKAIPMGENNKAAFCNSSIWKTSTIPDSWIWQVVSHPCSASDQESRLLHRQSTSELEGDAVVEEILNQQLISYTSLSQTHSELKLVPSLVPIWEEFERSGMLGVTVPLDPGKPPPSDVLRTLRGGLEFRDFLMESSNDIESTDKSSINASPGDYTNKPMSSSDANKLALASYNSSPQGCSQNQNENLLRLPKILLDQPPQQSDVKASDHDALRLLKWLASSQAAEDINSDDELCRDTILSPLLPVATIDKVLERANMDYESESQKECQDILDTVQDGTIFEELVSKSSSSTKPTNPSNSFSSDNIPQVDGSSDEASLKDTPSEVKLKISPYTPYIDDVLNNSTGCSKKMAKWGSLPIASDKRLFDPSVNQTFLNSAFAPESNFEATSETRALIKRKAGNYLDDIQGNSSMISYLKKGTGGNTESTMRDLMRRKRSCKIEQLEVITAELQEGLGESMRKENGTPSAEPRNDIINSLASSTVRLSAADTQIESEMKNISSVPVEYLEGCNMEPTIESDQSPRGINNEKIPSTILGEQSDPSDEGDYIGSDRWRSSEPIKYDICCSFQSNRKTDALLRPHKAVDSAFQVCSRYDKAPNPGTSLDGMKPINMKFHNQPPNIECQDTTSSHPSNILQEEINVEQFDRLETPYTIPPFFTPEHSSEHKLQFDEMHDCHVNHGSIMGVPIHCKIDGSYLHILTPKYSPPSRETVVRDLCVDDVNNLKTTIATEQELPSPKGSFTEDVVFICSDPGLCDPVHQTASVSNLEHGKDDKGSNEMNKMCFLGDTNRTSYNEGNNTRCEISVSHSEDISQISAPENRLKLTPLSQIGFRDPANVSGGQHLTLLSIEILADSRGDLRPDPRFDAINLVVLVFQQDNECEFDSHILLRCVSETTRTNLDGISDCKVFVFSEEKLLLNHFMKVICSFDPDILLGWDVQRESLGFLAERSAILGFNLLNGISRTPSDVSINIENLNDSEKDNSVDMLPEPVMTDTTETAVIEDEWGRTHASGLHVNGRIILNIWRLMRGEVKLNLYTIEAVAEAVLRRKVPCFSWKVLAKWFSSGPGCARYQCIDYIVGRTKLNLQITSQLDVINRTSELARVFGIDFFSVLSRGSQYRVESMFLRLAHTQNYLAISPGNTQVAYQPAMECIPLVMEPESGFYADPVVVLDFQSLYPSMIIAYNLCFCTCLGKVIPSKADTLGVSSYSPDKNVLQNLKHDILFTPNGVMYAPSKVRKGVLPRLLEEILSTRIMVKQAMKKLLPSQQVLHRVCDARQLALKLISNVTYGYTAAGFSGRMPCAELADSIVQCARRTLETAISFVNANEKWQAKVIYGDTDSMFVLLKGRSTKEAFQIGHEIAAAITEMNPYPVALKMEKVYHPCFLLTKKRYVGYSYESPDQRKAKFDAKGIETVRRDTCLAVAKMMEQSLRVFFEHKDTKKVKEYVVRQWKRILSGRVPLQDFIFAKEVRLGTYSSRVSSLPPAAIVASKSMRADPRAEPLYAERVPYIVVHGEPGARLVDMVVDPQELLAVDSPYRLNDMYYIKKQIIPALQRAFGLVGANLNQWLLDMPRPRHEVVGKSHSSVHSAHRTRIEFYYLSKHCILCDEMVRESALFCPNCSRNEATAAVTLITKTSKLERDIQHLASICRHCGGGDWRLESGIKCTSLACSVYYERRKVQKELRSVSAVASQTGLYPKCMVEYF